MSLWGSLLSVLKGTGIHVQIPITWTGYSKMPKHSEINWARFVQLGKQLLGIKYVFGAETNLKDSDPTHIKELDCSELVEWLFAQIGLNVPDGSYNQFKVSKPITGDPQIGDLGFKWIPETESVHHVGVWIGDGVLEAKGKKWGTVLTSRKDFENSPDWAMWRRLNQVQDA